MSNKADNRLPPEIWDMILKQVSKDRLVGKRTLSAFAQCSRVCQVASYRHLYEVVDLTPVTDFVYGVNIGKQQIKVLESILDLAPLNQIQQLVVWTAHAESINVMAKFMCSISNFRNLRALTLFNVAFTIRKLEAFRRAIIRSGCPIVYMAFGPIYTDSGTLDTPDFSDDIEDSSPPCLRLQELRYEVITWGYNDYQEMVRVRTKFLKTFLCETLTSLHFASNDTDKSHSRDILLTYQFPNLRKLELHIPFDEHYDSMSSFLENNPSIEELSLGHYCNECHFPPSMLPKLRKVTGYMFMLEILIPGRPVDSVVAYNLGGWYEGCAGFVGLGYLLRQSTAKSIRVVKTNFVYDEEVTPFVQEFSDLEYLSLTLDAGYIEAFASAVGGLKSHCKLGLTITGSQEASKSTEMLHQLLNLEYDASFE